MLATTERVRLLETAESLAKMISQSEVAEQYRICKYKLKNNKESQRKIQKFVRLKDQYEDAKRFGKYHPDYKKIMVQVRKAKRELDLDPFVAEFRLAENDLQSLLDMVSVHLAGAVSPQIKVPAGNPFFDTGTGCSGGCGTGGSCGCSA